MIKKPALSLVLCGLFLATLASAQEPTPPPYAGPREQRHVYLLIGQSNMAGRAPVPEEDAAVIPRCYLLNDKGQWEPATNPLNRYSTIRKGLGMQKLNPGYGFAKTMLAQEPGIAIGLVVNAKGGTRIEQWKKGTRFYDEAVRRAKEAQQTGVLKGILWHQGESNNGEPDGYLEKLTVLIADLRQDLAIPDLPFVAGQIRGPSAINDQLAKLPGTVAATGCASSEGLTTQDRWHFDTASMKLLGERYAKEMLRLQHAQETKRKETPGRQ